MLLYRGYKTYRTLAEASLREPSRPTFMLLEGEQELWAVPRIDLSEDQHLEACRLAIWEAERYIGPKAEFIRRAVVTAAKARLANRSTTIYWNKLQIIIPDIYAHCERLLRLDYEGIVEVVKALENH